MHRSSVSRFARFAFFVALLLCVASTAWAAMRFADPVAYPVGAGANAIAVLDLNGDLRGDIVVANAADSSVSVLLTDGAGGYLPRTDYAVGQSPSAVALDLADGDGLPDLIVANAGSSSISVLHGNGDGTFGTRTDYATGIEPIVILVADVTGEGISDVIVANAGSNDFSIFPGAVAAGLGARTDFPLPGSPRAITAGEWDDLYGLDLAFACEPNLVAPFGNDGVGAFSALTVQTVGPDPVGLVSYDLGNDGRLDLATANRGSDSFTFIPAIGGGAFGEPFELPAGHQPSSLSLADVDGDGWDDLVSSLEGDGAVTVLLGRENIRLARRQDVALGAAASAARATDVDGDQYLDLVALNAATDVVEVRLQTPILDGTVTFAVPPSDVQVGAIMTPAVQVLVLDGAGQPVADEAVWINMEGNGGLSGGDAEALTDVNGIATFDSLVTQGAGSVRLWAWTVTMGSEPSDWFLVHASAAVAIRFATEPTDVLIGRLMPHPVRVQATDLYGNAVPGISVALSLSGAGALSGGAARATDSDGYATFDSLSVDAFGLHRLLATSGALPQVTSAEFAVLPPARVLEFASRRQLSSGTGPMATAVADLDGDGVLDLVSANTQSENVSVSRGLGGGLFSTPLTYATGMMPISVLIRDFNGDGRLDIVTANRSGLSVSVLKGLADGTFAPKVDYTVGLWPWAMAAGDFNSDGRPDVAVANEGEYNISLLYGTSNGSFNVWSVPLPGYVVGIATGDVDEDGDLDLVASGNTTGVNVILGDGHGSFTASMSWLQGVYGARFISLADFNEDGHLDLAMASQSDGCVGVMLGDGHGAFGEIVRWTPEGGPYSLAVADMDGDAHLDLVTSSYLSHSFSVLPGTGRGSFLPAQNFAAAPFPAHVTVADVNADGYADVVTADNDLHSLGLFLQTRIGEATIAFVTQPSAVNVGEAITPPVRVKVSNAAGQGIGGVAVTLSLVGAGTLSDGGPIATAADGTVTFASLRVDSPGTHRLIASLSPTQQVTSDVFSVGAPVRLFAAARQFAVGPVLARTIAAADLNGDAAQDLVVGGETPASLSVLLGIGDGTYAPKSDIALPYSPTDVRIADVNRDGRLDLLVGTVNPSFLVLLGNGNGGFAAPVGYGTGNPSQRIEVGDLDRDGKPDVVTSASGSNYVSVWMGAGDGTFPTRRDWTVGGNPSGIVLRDVNGDGHPDLLAAAIATDKVAVLPGVGNGTFGTAAFFDAGDQPYDLIAGDWNGDGKLDLAAPNMDSSTVSILMGNGDGTFGPRQALNSGVQPYQLAAGDLDLDGRLDIVSGNMSRTFSVFRSLGGGQFAAKDEYTVQNPFDVVLADLDSNGSLDLAVPNYNAGKVSVFLNTMSLPTPTLVELFRATASAAGVRVEWQLSDATALRACALERAASEAGEWLAVNAAPRTEGAMQVVVDAEAPAGVTSWYRLRGTLRNGTPFTYGPVSAEGLAVVRTLELAAPWPNPSRGAATLSFGLPQRANVRLSLVDLQGREVALLADGVRDAGRHVALLDASDLSPGIYFARLQTGGTSLVRRFVIVK